MGATLASRSLLWIVATIHSITATDGIYVEAKNYYAANLSLDCTTMCLSSYTRIRHVRFALSNVHARGIATRPAHAPHGYDRRPSGSYTLYKR